MDDFQFWPLGRSIPEGWEFVSFLDRHHGNHAILIGRVINGSALGGENVARCADREEGTRGKAEV